MGARITARDGATAAVVGAGQVERAANGWTGPAIEKLARFEEFAQQLAERQQEISARLEQLKAQGKMESASFRQLFGEKLTLTNTLAMLAARDLV